ncbi:MAG: GNAT family N-acetyltransferase [Nanoarchaeota archaeon]|nr:GNAT family N-acetyltransferase [Nanoarchaeota archaeon]
MVIRLATKVDKAKVLKLYNELRDITEGKKTVISNEHRRRSEEIFRSVIERNDTHIFVAEENNDLIGLATFYLLPNIKHGWLRGHIEDMIVTKSVRGKGVGSQLLNEIKKYCSKHDIKVIKLDSGRELKQAHQFYKKNDGKQTELMFRFDIK